MNFSLLGKVIETVKNIYKHVYIDQKMGVA